jgi:hypothetical protein
MYAELEYNGITSKVSKTGFSNNIAQWTIDLSGFNYNIGDTLVYNIEITDFGNNTVEYSDYVTVINSAVSYSISDLENDTVEIRSANQDVEIIIPPGSVKQDLSGNLILNIKKNAIDDNKKDAVALANSKYENKVNSELEFDQFKETYYELNAYLNNESNDIGADFLKPGKFVILKFKYSDSLSPMIAQNLVINRLDESTAVWKKADGFQDIDFTDNKVEAYITHFSIYNMAPSYATDLANLQVYPNPWDYRTAAYKDDPSQYGIKFNKIPHNSRIRIYTVAGEKVIDFTTGSVDKWRWNLKNSVNQEVASGVYLYVIEGGGQKRTGKLGVIK